MLRWPLKLRRDLVKRFPDKQYYRPQALAYTALAKIELARENYPAALMATQAGRQVLEEHGAQDPDPRTVAEQKYRLLGVRLTALWATSPTAAIDAIDEYVAVADWLSEQDTKYIDYRAEGAYQLAKKPKSNGRWVNASWPTSHWRSPASYRDSRNSHTGIRNIRTGTLCPFHRRTS